MSRKPVKQIRGATYHAYSRGNQKECIFPDHYSIRFFLSELAKRVDRFGVEVNAYCVMSNHYHLAVTTPDANISEFMHSILTAYAMYRIRKGWVGHIFSSRFEAKRVVDANYLLNLTGYIHLNPVKAGMVSHPRDYPWSSYRAYACPARGHADGGDHAWLATSLLLDQFGNDPAIARERFLSFINERLEKLRVSRDHPADREERLVAEALAGTSLGVDGLLDAFRGSHVFAGDTDEKRIRTAAGLLQVLRGVLDYYGIDDLRLDDAGPGDLEDLAAMRKARRAFVYLARKHTDASNAEIARILGNVGATAVSGIYGRMCKAGESNEILGEIEAVAMRDVRGAGPGDDCPDIRSVEVEDRPGVEGPGV